MASLRFRCLSYLYGRVFKQSNAHKYLSSYSGPIDFPDFGPPIPEYTKREAESLENQKARLIYQSRKRGMSENGLLLSTFVAKYMDKLDKKLLDQYDTLINQPSNDWEIYYWMTKVKPTPEEFDNEIMDMLKMHTHNEHMETRFHQPPLDHEKTPTAS